MPESVYPVELILGAIRRLNQFCVNFQGGGIRSGTAVNLFLLVESIDVFRNETFHDSTLWLQDLQDWNKDEILKLNSPNSLNCHARFLLQIYTQWPPNYVHLYKLLCINSAFTKFVIFSFCWHCRKYTEDWHETVRVNYLVVCYFFNNYSQKLCFVQFFCITDFSVSQTFSFISGNTYNIWW